MSSNREDFVSWTGLGFFLFSPQGLTGEGSLCYCIFQLGNNVNVRVHNDGKEMAFALGTGGSHHPQLRPRTLRGCEVPARWCSQFSSSSEETQEAICRVGPKLHTQVRSEKPPAGVVPPGVRSTWKPSRSSTWALPLCTRCSELGLPLPSC